MHGNRNISEYAPDGHTSETVFAQEGFSPGIRQGVVISLWVKTGQSEKPKQVLYCDSFNQAKAKERRQALLSSLDDPHRETRYVKATPTAGNRLSFKPSDVARAYANWPTLIMLARKLPLPGVEECRAGDLFDINRDALEKRIKQYFDPTKNAEDLKPILPGLFQEGANFHPVSARAKFIASELFGADNIVRYAARPFDTRWCYHTICPPLWNRSRPALRQQLGVTKFLVSRFNTAASIEGFPLAMTSGLMDKQMINRNPGAIPLVIQAEKNATQADWFQSVSSNLSPMSVEYIKQLGLPCPDTDRDTAELIWMHALAIGYSPAYLNDNADGIRENWPRIPLPETREALLASAALGREVAALLDTETSVPGVTSGSIRDELKTIAVVSRVGGGALKPAEFFLTAGWGSGGHGSPTMPGKGKTAPRAAGIDEQNADFGSAPTLDVYLNATAYWRNISQPVYDFTIGGYQVIKKWLSYRDQRVLGRAMTMAEIMEVTAMARRLAALVLMQPRLDKNYHAVAAATWTFS